MKDLTMSIFGLCPINLPTRVEAIVVILLLTSSSEIAIVKDPFLDPGSTLIARKEDLPEGLTPNSEDYLVICAPGSPALETRGGLPRSLQRARGSPSLFSKDSSISTFP